MLRRGQTTTFQERLDITERATVGQSDFKIAATHAWLHLDGAQASILHSSRGG
jgi:hypothetical protein